MPEEIAMVLAITSICAGVAAIVAAVQLGSVFRARAAAAHEIEYRDLLRQANEAQHRVSESLDRAVAEIAQLRSRSESMERLLQEVG